MPTAAIQRGAPGAYVYVVNADNTVSVRPIKLGPTDGPMAAVTSGLSAGERVVVDGTDRLRDGARVSIPAAAGQAAAPATEPPPTTPTRESRADAGAAAPDAQSSSRIIRKIGAIAAANSSRGAASANSVKILRDDEAMR